MKKVVYIIGINLAVVFIVLLAYFIEEIGKWVTYTGSLCSVIFFVLFFLLEFWSFVRVKTATMIILSTIGMSLSGLLFILNFGVLLKPKIFQFDEIGAIYIFYALAILGFCIIGLIHSIRLEKLNRTIER